MKTNIENQRDKSPEEQQQEAWYAVYETLCEVAPELMHGGSKNGRETACDAIRALVLTAKAQEVKINGQVKALSIYDTGC